jgi:hypothetical protein
VLCIGALRHQVVDRGRQARRSLAPRISRLCGPEGQRRAAALASVDE